MSWLNRFANLFRTGQLDRELDEELQFHVNARMKDSVAAGMTPEEARRDAERRFGNETLTRETARELNLVGWIETLGQDIRYAIRTLRGNPVFMITAALSLALGIGANVAIFSLIDALLLKTLPVAHPEQLYFLTASGNAAFSYPGYETLRDRNDVFSDTFTFSGETERWNVLFNGQAELTNGQAVTGNFFSALGVNAIAGRAITSGDDTPSAPPAAVISYAYWTKKFARAASAVGSQITINGVPFTIVGVAPPEFFGVAVGSAPEIWKPFTLQTELGSPSTWWLSAMARLKPGVSEQRARANLEVILPLVHRAMEFRPKSSDDLFKAIELHPAATGISSLRDKFSLPLRVLMIVVGLVLLIACANIANLLLSRATTRQREMAIRLALGGGRGRLIRQLLTESILLAILGGALGLLFAVWSGNLLIAFLASGQLPADLTLKLDARALAFTGGISLLTGILFGVAPAIRATRVDPGPALKENPLQVAGSRLTLGKALVVAQVAISLLLLTCAGLFVRTLQNLRTRDLGFNTDNVLVMTIEPALAGYKGPALNSLYQRMLERIGKIPGVRSASMSRFGLIGAGFSSRNISVPGYVPQTGKDRGAAANLVGPKFFETTGIPLLAGREFTFADSAGAARVAIVNDKFARFYFGEESPIGKHFGFGPRSGETYEIVGVVRDAKYFQLRREVPRTAFTPVLQSESGAERMIVEVRTAANPAGMASAVQGEIQSIIKGAPVHSVRTQAQQLDATLVQERLLATLSGFFSLLAAFLTCIGLYGVMAYSVARRTSEIGIRVALGAEYGNVLWLILRESALLVAIGLAFGVGATLATTGWISKMLFGLAPNDTATILGSALTLTAVAVFATWLPARRAARVDPIVALRHN